MPHRRSHFLHWRIYQIINVAFHAIIIAESAPLAAAAAAASPSPRSLFTTDNNQNDSTSLPFVSSYLVSNLYLSKYENMEIMLLGKGKKKNQIGESIHTAPVTNYHKLITRSRMARLSARLVQGSFHIFWGFFSCFFLQEHYRENSKQPIHLIQIGKHTN